MRRPWKEEPGRGHERNIIVESEMKLISAKEIRVEYHISLSTINYYTNLGLLHIADRRGNMRLYNPDLVRKRMEEIRRLRHEGFPLRLIQRRIFSSSGDRFSSGLEL